MVHPAFIPVLLLLAGFAVQVAYAQSMAVQSAPLPVIEGKINGMDVVAQGDSVAFFAGKLPSEYSDESCAEDLHCTMHKNHTRAVMISPDGIRLLQLNHLEQDEDEEVDSNSIVLPSQTLNTLDSSSSFSFKELFISTEEIEPTPTLATLYTGNPVVDQTSGLEWINNETIKLLAITVETVNLLSTSTSSSDFDESTLIDPAPTATAKVMTTILGELDELRRRLMSSATVPVVMPTPVRISSEDPELESDEVWLETEFNVLTIRPTPSRQNGRGRVETNSLTYSVKQVGTTSDSVSHVSPSTSSTPVQVESQTEGATTVCTPTETNSPAPCAKALAECEGEKDQGETGALSDSLATDEEVKSKPVSKRPFNPLEDVGRPFDWLRTLSHAELVEEVVRRVKELVNQELVIEKIEDSVIWPEELLPPLSLEEIHKLIERCYGDAIVLIKTKPRLLKKQELLKMEEVELQGLFGNGGKYEWMRYIPDYTPEQIIQLMLKHRRVTGYSYPASIMCVRMLSSEELRKKELSLRAGFDKRSGHINHIFCHIKILEDYGIDTTHCCYTRTGYVPDYSDKEKRDVILKFLSTFEEGLAGFEQYRLLLAQATQLKIHQVFHDDFIRFICEQIKPESD